MKFRFQWVAVSSLVLASRFQLPIAMAPKVKKAAKAPTKATSKAGGKPASLDKEAAEQLRRDQSDVLTQLRNSKDPAKQRALALYKATDRMSTEKGALLQQRLQDKSCK